MSCGPGLTCGVCWGMWRVGGAGFGTGYGAGQAWAVGGMDAGGVGGRMEVGLEVVVWCSMRAERPSVGLGMPVAVALAAGRAVEGEKELRKWLVVSAQGSRDGARRAWKAGLG